MKRLFLYAAALLLAPALQSCSDDPAPSEPTGETKITFTQNAEARFAYTRLDTAASNLNNPMPDGRDTVSQVTVNTNASYEGKSNVAMKANQYLLAGDRDTSYFWQESNGDLYQHNFGLDLINSPDVQAVINQEVKAGWVIVAKMGASSGTTWTALQETFTLINLFNMEVTVTDVATANGTVKMTIDGEQVDVKKFTHDIKAKLVSNGAQAASTVIEVYVSPKHGGVVRTVRKVSNITLPLQAPAKAIGADLNLVTYVKP